MARGGTRFEIMPHERSKENCAITGSRQHAKKNQQCLGPTATTAAATTTSTSATKRQQQTCAAGTESLTRADAGRRRRSQLSSVSQCENRRLVYCLPLVCLPSATSTTSSSLRFPCGRSERAKLFDTIRCSIITLNFVACRVRAG